MEEIKPTGRRLTKKPPASHLQNLTLESRIDNSSLRSQRSSGSLQRAPSAPYPRSNNNSGHVHTGTSPNPAAYASSNSSLDRQVSSGPSPILAGSEFNAPPGQSGGKRFSNPTRSLNEKTSEEFIGAPFDGSGILNHIDSTKASGFQNSLRRPPPPPLSHTSPDPRMMSPPLRQSQSFSAADRMSEKTPPRVGENQLISPKRYSDEAKDSKNAALKKKSGFSGFMNSLVGSPRRVNISAPENPVHVTHVGYDNETGQFTVSDSNQFVCVDRR
jgi:p21-activated kinase 1